MLGQRKLSYQTRGVTAAEPSSVFAFKSLYSPIAVVVTLFACLDYWGDQFSGPYVLVAVLAFFGAADFLEIGQVHDGLIRLSALRSLIDIAVRWFMVAGFIFALLYLSTLWKLFDPDALKSWAVATPIVLWMGELVLLRLGLNRIPPKRAVVIGMTELGLKLVDKIGAAPLLRTDIVGFFEDRSPDRLPVATGLSRRILGKLAEVSDFVLTNDIHVVYITLPMSRDSRIVNLLESLLDSTASVYFIPNVFGFNLIQAQFDFLDGIPLMAVRESPFYGLHGITKRLSDVLIAGILIALLSPLLIGIALGVRLTSKGPAIFKQKRYGLNGKPIIVYKFRSMSVTEDGESTYTQVCRNDTRVTPFGAFIRRLSLAWISTTHLSTKPEAFRHAAA
jgi:Bacterial sugar transferase/CoA-binding domain